MNNLEERQNYYCVNCETSFASEKELKNCIFCNAILHDNSSIYNIKYNYIIPFTKNEKDCISIIKKYVFKKKLVSSKFNILKNKKNLYGIYMPVWLVDFETAGEVDFDCKKITKFKSKKNKYVKTDSHLVTIGGSMNFNNIPIYTSKCNNKEIFDSFNYNNKKEFDIKYLESYILEAPQLKLKETIALGELRAKEMFVEKIQKEVGKYDSCNIKDASININNIKKECILVPLWVYTTDYKGKIYNIVVNGQNGKIFENIPISIKKMFFIWLLIFILLFILLFILFNYKVML